MRRPTSLTRRVAWGTTLAATGAALFAAGSTTWVAVGQLREAEDRRLTDAAKDLAFLLDSGPASMERVQASLTYEQNETAHSGVGLTVLDAAGEVIAGTRLDPSAPSPTCGDEGPELRYCVARTQRGLTVLASAFRAEPLSAFVTSTLLAAFGTGVLGFLLSFGISQRAVAPLGRLRRRLAGLDLESGKPADLGPPEQVQEVDELREALGTLLERTGQAIEQAERFAANAAHELRTPLTTALAELELLGESEALAEDGRADVARVRARVAEISGLVEHLLILSRPLGPSSLPDQTVSLRDVVDDAFALLPDEQKNRVESCRGDAVVLGDEVLLAILLANAIGNALKFGRRARVEVYGEGEARLVVLDDGPGLEEGERERVFEPFYRGSAESAKPGHGLGLPLVRHIARAHGGSARFVDAERGARLEIRLPLAPVSAGGTKLNQT